MPKKTRKKADVEKLNERQLEAERELVESDVDVESPDGGEE